MKKFTNTTNKEFTCSWDGKEQTFLPNESAILEDGIAKVFAKHLANLRFGGSLVASDQLFLDEMSKFLSEVSTEVEEIAEQVFIEVEKETNKEKEEEAIEETVQKMVEVPKKKGRKAKKEEIFEGLDNETTI